MSDHTIPTRRCNICEEEYPLTSEYFNRGKGNRGGFLPTCKPCHAQLQATRVENMIKRNQEQGYEVPATKVCSVCGTEYPATREHFYPRKEARDGLRKDCRKCFDAKQNEWKARNADRVKETSRAKTNRYRGRNRDKVLASTREWKAANKDKIQAYRDANKRAFALYARRRRDRKAGLADDLTLAQWQAAVDHFCGCCAYCGRQPDLFQTLCVEHFIPISSPDCPGTTVSNILPACAGVAGCNNKKHNKEPHSWVIATFGKAKGAKILKRIREYFDSVRLS